MLKPAMKDLMDKVGNRYLLVNLAAQRARDISASITEDSDPLLEKSVKIALDEIVDGKIVIAEQTEEVTASTNDALNVFLLSDTDLFADDEAETIEEDDADELEVKE